MDLNELTGCTFSNALLRFLSETDINKSTGGHW